MGRFDRLRQEAAATWVKTMSPEAKRTLLQRLRKNLKHVIPRPLRRSSKPREFSKEELLDLRQGHRREKVRFRHVR